MSDRAPGRDLLALGLGATLLFTVSLGARDLWNPNEPAYGEGVVEMAASGDWLLPTVNDRVFAEKPILYYWLALVASAALGGVSETTLRLPCAAAGVVSVLMLYLLVVPYAGAFRARLAAVLFATTQAVFWGARTAQMDILVTATTLGAILAASRVVDHGTSPRTGWSLAGFAAGVGFLAKGPVGLVCPALAVVAYLAATGRLRALLSPAVALGALVFFVSAAPWYVALAGAGRTDALFEMLFRQNVVRFLDPWDHARPFWYFLVYFWIDMAPWAWFVPAAAVLPFRDDGERKLDRLAWVWIVTIVVFFSLSSSKRSAYILPVAPAAAILVSGLAAQLLDGRLSRGRARACLAIQAVVATLMLALVVVLHLKVVPRYPDLLLPARALIVLLIGGGAAILMAFLARGRVRAAVSAAFASLVVSIYLVASVAVLPALDAYKSARGFCDKVVALVEPDGALISYQLWQWRASYAFYARRTIPNVTDAEELDAYWRRPTPVYVIVEDVGFDGARAALGPIEPVLHARVGSKNTYLFSNR